MDKIILHGASLKVTKLIDVHAPNDRRETVTVEGIMRSPSDGYHTFDELYDHRITLFIALCHCIDSVCKNEFTGESWSPVWRSKIHSDGTSMDGWFIMGINKEKGKQITYHLPLFRWEETNFAQTLDRAPHRSERHHASTTW